MKKVFLLFAVIFAAQTLGAQSIDQSVEVNNAYIVQFENIQRGNIKPTIADTLYKFDYKFDYSVFDSPYKGAFDFSPYEVRLTPEPRRIQTNKFYLKAGAGLSLRPVFDFAYTPVAKNNFWLNISNVSKAYIGSYGATKNRASYFGRDISDNFKISTKWLYKKHIIAANLGLVAISAKTNAYSTTALNPYFQAGLSTIEALNEFNYSINFKYRFMNQMYSDSKPYRYDHSEINASVIPYKGNDLRIRFNFIYSFTNNLKLASVSPLLLYAKDKLNAKLGVKFDYLYKSNQASKPEYGFSPVVDINYVFIPNKFEAYFGAAGDKMIVSQIDITNNFSMYTTQFGNIISNPKLRAFVGFKGELVRYFQYNIEAGFIYRSTNPLEIDQNLTRQLTNIIYANAKLAWHSERIDFDSLIEYNNTKSVDKMLPNAYLPSSFKMSLDAKYNWLRRVYLGINIKAASSRKDIKAMLEKVPGFVDLGFNGEYKFSSNMSAWIQTGNLLCQPIQEHIGFIQKSPFVTVGISLVL